MSKALYKYILLQETRVGILSHYKDLLIALSYMIFLFIQERQVALIRELLIDKDTMSRLNENERQTLMQSIQVSHMQADDMRSPRKRPYGIDQSSASILSPSDISYDTTADDLVSFFKRNYHIIEYNFGI